MHKHRHGRNVHLSVGAGLKPTPTTSYEVGAIEIPTRVSATRPVSLDGKV